MHALYQKRYGEGIRTAQLLSEQVSAAQLRFFGCGPLHLGILILQHSRLHSRSSDLVWW